MNGYAMSRCPPLVTFRRSATWVNRAGRVDRSACMEVRASEVRGLVQKWKSAGRKENRPHAEADGEVELTGRLLRKLETHRLPFKLMGDLRTRKSNAMKDPRNTRRKSGGDATRQVDRSAEGGREMNASNGVFNPNHGASRTKLLGFFAEPEFMSGWSQRVHVVRWRSHERLAQHFLICPSCECKYLKLFAVLCSNQELHDATTAEAWIESIDARHAAAGRTIDAEVMEFRAQLISRYGLLFRRRRLVCRKCLGVRYGEVKVKRQNVEASKRQNEGESDAAREQTLREAERRARRREQNREWRRLMKEGMPHLEKAREAIARMRKVEALVSRFDRSDATSKVPRGGRRAGNARHE